MDNQLKLTALPPEKVVEILARSGFRDMTMQKLERDISAGLPLNGHGTVNFFEYMAWMVKELNSDGNDSE